MVTSQYIRDNHSAWEVSPSTRQSYHVWTKYAPVDVTLTTAGTAQNLISIATVDDPTINIATNPSFETGTPPTGYTASGAALAQSAAVTARNGSFSLEINPDNLAAGEGAYWTSPVVGGPGEANSQLYLITSAYFRDAAASGDDVRIAIRNTSNTLLTAGNTVDLSATFTRSVAAYPLTVATAAYRVYFETAVQHNTTFYVDSFQVEVSRNSHATAYTDGSLGLNYEWMNSGTAHASVSRRRKGVFVIRGFSLHFTRDTYIAFDHTATSSTGIFMRAGSDWTNPFPLQIQSNISFLNVNTGELPRVWGTVWGVHASERPE